MNIAILMGNIGQDPELRMTSGGNAVLKFSLATSYKSKDDAGNQREKTEWHRCVMFGKRAETLGRMLQKGSKVSVRGRISYGSYEANDGTKRYTTDIIVDDLEFAGSKRDAGEYYPPAERDEPKAPPMNGLDEDIPF